MSYFILNPCTPARNMLKVEAFSRVLQHLKLTLLYLSSFFYFPSSQIISHKDITSEGLGKELAYNDEMMTQAKRLITPLNEKKEKVFAFTTLLFLQKHFYIRFCFILMSAPGGGIWVRLLGLLGMTWVWFFNFQH